MRPGFLDLEIIMSKLQDQIKIKFFFSSFGAKLWNAIPNEFRELSKGSFKNHFHDLLLSIGKHRMIMLKNPFCYKNRKICSHDVMHK